MFPGLKSIKSQSEKTQGWWRNKTVLNGRVNRLITALGNVQIKLKIPYFVERDSTQQFKNCSRKRPHQGFCPFLRWLSLEEGVTPYVWATVAKYGTISHSFETAQKTLLDWGIHKVLTKMDSLIELVYRFHSWFIVLKAVHLCLTSCQRIHLSLKRMERLTYQFGQIALSQRNLEVDSYLCEEMTSGDELKGKRVVISVDGGRTKVRNSTGKSPNP